jgi:hypothetical protein
MTHRNQTKELTTWFLTHHHQCVAATLRIAAARPPSPLDAMLGRLCPSPSVVRSSPGHLVALPSHLCPAASSRHSAAPPPPPLFGHLIAPPNRLRPVPPASTRLLPGHLGPPPPLKAPPPPVRPTSAAPTSPVA